MAADVQVSDPRRMLAVAGDDIRLEPSKEDVVDVEQNVAQLVDLLQLTPADPIPGTRETEFYCGRSQYKPDGRVFGGQVLAQCVMAAGQTVDATRPIHSLHGYFLRPGDVSEPITFGVEVLRDGGSFSARRVHAYQRDEPIMSVMASFQQEQDGLEHGDELPADVPPPEDCPQIAELLADVDIPFMRDWLRKRPFDVRPVEPPIYFEPDPAASAQERMWIRTLAPFPEDPLLNAAALAYASDFNLLEPVLRRQGLTWTTPGLRMASLDHAMWWHRPVRVDEWMLYSETSPSARGGRGLGLGRIFSRSGQLLATVAQEGMVRIKPRK
nr:acyl-CoA thioesterase II [Brevibacterium otitidis]